MITLDKPLLTTDELARLLRVDPSTVRRWRTSDPVQGPPFIQLSDRVTKYSAADVEAWLASMRVVPAVSCGQA
jgi:hypothetical protein